MKLTYALFVAIAFAAVAASQLQTPPTFPTRWLAKISTGAPVQPFSMACDYQKGTGLSRADFTAAGVATTMVWDFRFGKFYMVTNNTCTQSTLRSSIMNPLPSFGNFTFAGTTTIGTKAVEIWVGRWTVPGAYQSSYTYYNPTQTIAEPVQIYFNPYPNGKNNQYNFNSYTTDFSNMDVFQSVISKCFGAPPMRESTKQAAFAALGLDACQFAA